ncbi:MAG: glycerate kinase type-2 family protein [Promethearchaeota archaeon]
MYIKNATKLLGKELDQSQKYLRKLAIAAIERSLDAVKPQNLINKAIKIQDNVLFIYEDQYDLREFKNIFIIGGGKATAEMAFSLEELLQKNSNITYEGVINIPKGIVKPEKLGRKIKLNYATHPIPNIMGLKGTRLMMKLVETSGKDDLFIFLISGGGSALLPLPKPGITLQDLQNVNSLLLASGASIQEINTIRKHISDFKGGNLAKKLYNTSKATLISLIISDVIGDNLDSIASGPSVPDTTTFTDVVDILKKFNIKEKIPPSIINHIEKGLLDNNLETPKSNSDCFNNVHNYIVGSVKSAVEEVTLIGTGELTVTIKGKGIGGRNQEMLLSFLDSVKEKQVPFEFLIVGANLDGIEGNSEAMGALIDNFVLNQINKKSLEIKNYLESNNSNNFFKSVETEIITGPTGCNVNDLLIVLLQKKN